MSDTVASGLARAIDVLIKFEIELKFAYFMDEPERIENASTNLVECKKVLTDILEEAIQYSPNSTTTETKGASDE